MSSKGSFLHRGARCSPSPRPRAPMCCSTQDSTSLRALQHPLRSLPVLVLAGLYRNRLLREENYSNQYFALAFSATYFIHLPVNIQRSFRRMKNLLARVLGLVIVCQIVEFSQPYYVPLGKFSDYFITRFVLMRSVIRTSDLDNDRGLILEISFFLFSFILLLCLR